MHACIGEGTGNPLQYSCLENPRDRGAWWAAIYGVKESRTRLKRLSSSSSSKIHLFIYIHSHHCVLDFLCEIIGSILSTKIWYFWHFLNRINNKSSQFSYPWINLPSVNFSSVQLLSLVQLLMTPWTAVRQASLSSTNSQSRPKPMSIVSVMPSNHLILCRPLLLLPSIFQIIRIFSNESALCIRWPKCWIFSFNISPSNEHPGLISFRMD